MPRAPWSSSPGQWSRSFRNVTAHDLRCGIVRFDIGFRQQRHGDFNARPLTGLRVDLQRAEDLLATLTHARESKAARGRRRLQIETFAPVRYDETKLVFFPRQLNMYFGAVAMAHGVLHCFL